MRGVTLALLYAVTLGPGCAGTETGNPGPARAGLYALYYGDDSFDDAVFEQVDPTVDFDWGDSTPDDRLADDRFAIRWSGSLRAPFSESFELIVSGNGAVKLLLDGETLVDGTLDAETTELSTTVAVQADTPSRIVLQYRDDGGPASLQLSWSSPSVPRAIIPTEALTAERLSAAEIDGLGRRSCATVGDCPANEVCAAINLRIAERVDGRTVATRFEQGQPSCIKRCDTVRGQTTFPTYSGSADYPGDDTGCPAGQICDRLGACVPPDTETGSGTETEAIRPYPAMPCDPDGAACTKLYWTNDSGNEVDFSCSDNGRDGNICSSLFGTG
jgi:hypothetical protein